MTQQCICGIVVAEEDTSGFPAYQWALALHPSDYLALDVRVFDIVKKEGTATWRTQQRLRSL